ncbi:helix-turn-helix domain-containing protein [Microbacterium sp. TNHR37B]|uniref:helix-turn-helix domain-containing protein n=1 Tax=Microbacterium sp. TNHR37B TaxID=1775956 RepID=UPI001E5DC52D|nr:helix-turn-helix transcriptional regulator [Microbacterium sp. TNHR37B]
MWREALGAELRWRRAVRGETLASVAARAGVSGQYLSEIERGRKEASSEVLAALGRAHGMSLSAVLRAVATRLDAAELTPGRRSRQPGAGAPSPASHPRSG